jgi:hypothetical protein
MTAEGNGFTPDAQVALAITGVRGLLKNFE